GPAVWRRIAFLRTPGPTLSRCLIRGGIAGNGVLLGQPCAEVDEPAALAAEGSIGRLRPVDLALAGGTLDALDGHHAQQVSRNLTSESAWVGRSERPFQARKRMLQR